LETCDERGEKEDIKAFMREGKEGVVKLRKGPYEKKGDFLALSI